MDEKIPVIIEPMQRTQYSFRNLDYCKQCGSYTTLKETSCLKCDGDKFITFESMIDQMHHRRNKKDILVLLNIFLVTIILGGVIFPMSMKSLAISVLILITCIAGLIIIQKKFSEKLKIFETQEVIEKERYVIEQSLEQDYQKTNNDLENENHLEAYRGLRNIGTIIKTKHIKISKITCLNRFVLRSDMPLELEELLLPTYNKDLVEYIYEVSKLQRSLIKQPAIEYIVEYEGAIQEDFAQADIILGNLAGAACYSKSSLELNKDFIIRCIEYIPEDRIARIEKLISGNTKYDWDTLQEAILNRKGASYEQV